MKNTINGVEFEIAPNADLRGANLHDANLIDADLRDADLRDADLRGANLRDADLRGANLRGANLRGANLRGAYLDGAYLRDAYLSGAKLIDAYLRGADLSGANLIDAYLSGAYLSGANLSGAYLSGANLSDAKLPAFQIPQTGALTVFKKLHAGKVAMLRIPEDARRTATPIGRKCRAEFADVLQIWDAEGREVESGVTRNECKYRVGERVHPDSYNDDVRVECTNGVHFFLTREEAEEW